jgi:hypothetical protein
MGGIFSVAITFLTVGFKHSTFDELLWVGCLFIAASIASGCLYRANPETAWDLFTVWRKVIPAPKDVPKVLVVILAMGLPACAAKQSEIVSTDPMIVACLQRVLQVAGSGPATDGQRAYVAAVCGKEQP